ncbi:hypothetical protein XELAEV_18013090mg [Xenopus laevis]|uniref:Uncharacterized protein n=1 Tax=Xenopus laevis TaxID=8355 RepID=A0A974DQ82_XENLA|nr:hypothetical protein XELAEV_18013090mg [Xenopus laevis]
MKDKKISPEQSSSQTEPPDPTQKMPAQDIIRIPGPLLDQKLAGIKHFIGEILQQLTDQTQRLTEKCNKKKLEYLQTRWRTWNKLKLVGIPETVKEKDPESLLLEWLPQELQLDMKTASFQIADISQDQSPPSFN